MNILWLSIFILLGVATDNLAAGVAMGISMALIMDDDEDEKRKEKKE